MRLLSADEKAKIRLLTKNQVSLALIEPTQTGLNKSIMDATGTVRTYFKELKIHDYDEQLQGPIYKVLIQAKIYDGYHIINSTASLYRPVTKKGDPRIWFSGLGKIANAHDIIAIVYFDGILHVFNLTQTDIEAKLNSNVLSPFKELILEINNQATVISRELLGKLYKIAKSGPIRSTISADTAVGRTLETALGININSSKQPDYKGIELKAFRKSKSNRKNLFAQVPDWELSKFKSSEEILSNFGYSRGDELKLYCTVSTKVRNSQGLNLRLDAELKHLVENSDKPNIGDFVLWTLETLHKRLHEKHKETFWVEAESTREDGKEYFQYTKVEHTQKPIIPQFDILLDQGIITLDHLIKRNKHGKVVEKGPLFKINPKGIDLLFPPSKKYNLML